MASDLGERLEINSEARLRLGTESTTVVYVVTVTRSRHISAVVGFQHLRTDGFRSGRAAGDQQRGAAASWHREHGGRGRGDGHPLPAHLRGGRLPAPPYGWLPIWASGWRSTARRGCVLAPRARRSWTW